MTHSDTKHIAILEQTLIQQKSAVENWFCTQWQQTPPPIYASIDLRYAGFKIAPIDMNLFPSGFNNLNPSALQLSAMAAKRVLHTQAPGAKNILLIPESHTRNMFYWENIKALQIILQEAGFLVTIGVLPEAYEQLRPSLSTLQPLTIYPITRKATQLISATGIPDLIVLNNDLASGAPEAFNNLQQPILPPAQLGWHQRLKSNHFRYYQQVAEDFAQTFSFDAWLITPLFKDCQTIDFMKPSGMECLFELAEALFTAIKAKYATYHITQPPFLVIKADQGTYGMAVMTIRNASELKQLNRKRRSHMTTSKGGQPVTRVIIQEGVYTIETAGEDNHVAEPVIYLWGDCVVGGFHRIHHTRGIDENLNAPGMQFQPFQLQHCYLYEIIAKLSMLAAAREMKQFTI